MNIGKLGLSTVALILALGLGSPAAHAQSSTEDPLYSFIGPEGSTPYSTLVNVSGKLYGTTSVGGGHSLGSVFSYDPATNKETTVYLFGDNGPGDGASSYAGMIYDSTRKLLYGTTYSGGSAGQGTIFSIDPVTNAERIVYSIGSGTGDGGDPFAGLIEINGILFGTTIQGGTANEGTVFSFDPTAKTFKTIHSFTNTNGEGNTPHSALTFDSATGKLYGTTQLGGTGSNGSGFGTIFSIDPTTSAFSTIYAFTGQADGAQPHSGLLDINGTLYGTAYYGGANSAGTLFSMSASTHTFTPLYSFGTNSASDGISPYADLTYDSTSGKLFGSTVYGGANRQGMIYSYDLAAKTEASVYSFTATNGDGGSPFASLLDMNGTFYGTNGGGGTGGYGTIFSLTQAALPMAKNDSGRGIANHTIVVAAPGVLGNDNNGGDPNTTAAIVTNPTHGSISFKSDGSFTYTPNTNFVGNDSFTYKDTNSAGTSNTATCSLTIGPIAYNDAGRTYYNTPVTINAPGVLANDVTGGLATTASLVTNPSHGTITFNSNGSFTYTPTNGFLGTDSFTYKITNTGGTSAPATCTMTVQARTPIANNDAGRVTHNTTLTITAPGVLGNDNPGDTGTVTAAIVTNPTHGTITFNSNGSFVYKPITGFIGTDSFTYKDTNAVGTSNTATCTLTVQ